MQRTALCDSVRYFMLCKLEQRVQENAFDSPSREVPRAKQTALRRSSDAVGVVTAMKKTLGYRGSGNPIGEQGQHSLKVGRVGKSVISAGKNLQVLGACQ